MASRFDPTPFLAREEQALAGHASDFAWPATPAKSREISDFDTVAKASLAPVATLAGGLAKNTPWNALVKAFASSPRPIYVSAGQWDEITGEAEIVEERWGEVAYAAGWSALDLYGCPPDPTARRYGQSGLVHTIVELLSPVRIVALDSQSAVLRPFKGDDMRYRRQRRTGTVHLWEAYRPTTGP